MPIVTGSVSQPVCTTAANDKPKPETTIAACSTYFAENVIPAYNERGSGTTERSAMPNTIASTGAPASGTIRAASVARTAVATATSRPGSIGTVRV